MTSSTGFILINGLTWIVFRADEGAGMDRDNDWLGLCLGPVLLAGIACWTAVLLVWLI